MVFQVNNFFDFCQIQDGGQNVENGKGYNVVLITQMVPKLENFNSLSVAL